MHAYRTRRENINGLRYRSSHGAELFDVTGYTQSVNHSLTESNLGSYSPAAGNVTM